MELHEYALEVLADERLREARARAAVHGLIARAPRGTLRARLGRALIAAGERLLAATPPRSLPRASRG